MDYGYLMIRKNVRFSSPKYWNKRLSYRIKKHSEHWNITPSNLFHNKFKHWRVRRVIVLLPVWTHSLRAEKYNAYLLYLKAQIPIKVSQAVIKIKFDMNYALNYTTR